MEGLFLLARKDSNPDKQNQNLLCYRYTTGHRVLFSKAGQRYYDAFCQTSSSKK